MSLSLTAEEPVARDQCQNPLIIDHAPPPPPPPLRPGEAANYKTGNCFFSPLLCYAGAALYHSIVLFFFSFSALMGFDACGCNRPNPFYRSKLFSPSASSLLLSLVSLTLLDEALWSCRYKMKVS